MKQQRSVGRWFGPTVGIALFGVACTSSRLESSPTPPTADGPVMLDLGPGTLMAGTTSSVTPLGGTDSTMGRMTASEWPGDLSFDIGGMAGTRVHEAMRSECDTYLEHTTDSGRVRRACVRDDTLYVTWMARNNRAIQAFPANFTVSGNGADIDAVLAVLDTYEPHSPTTPVNVWIPRGLEHSSDGMGGMHWAMTLLESDPVVLQTSVDRYLGLIVEWRRVGDDAIERRDVMQLGSTFPAVWGPAPSDVSIRVDAVVFETAVSPTTEWEPTGDGYREVHRVSLSSAGASAQQAAGMRCLPVVVEMCGCVYGCAPGVAKGDGNYSVSHDFWPDIDITATVEPWCFEGQCTTAFFARDVVCSGLCAARAADPSCHFEGATCKSLETTP